MYDQLVNSKPTNIRELFNEVFQELGMTCLEVSKAIGLNNSTLHRYTRGDVTFRKDALDLVLQYLEKRRVSKRLLNEIKGIDTQKGYGKLQVLHK